jgi:hypothetical protein
MLELSLNSVMRGTSKKARSLSSEVQSTGTWTEPERRFSTTRVSITSAWLGGAEQGSNRIEFPRGERQNMRKKYSPTTAVCRRAFDSFTPETCHALRR